MDIEQIIKKIAEEVYVKLQDQGISVDSSAAPATGAATGNGIMLTCMKPDAKITDIQNACKTAVNSSCAYVCVPQWFVSYAKEQIGSRSVKIATILGLPGGTTSSFAKYAEAKQAVVSGANTVIIPVNMQLCLHGGIDEAKKDLQEVMVPAKDKASVAALIEMNQINANQLAQIVDMCASCRVDMVLLSYNQGGKADAEAVRTVKGMGVCTGVFGGGADVNALRQAGACVVASSRI